MEIEFSKGKEENKYCTKCQIPFFYTDKKICPVCKNKLHKMGKPKYCKECQLHFSIGKICPICKKKAIEIKKLIESKNRPKWCIEATITGGDGVTDYFIQLKNGEKSLCSIHRAYEARKSKLQIKYVSGWDLKGNKILVDISKKTPVLIAHLPTKNEK